jgi:hypothetical protein
MDWVLAWLTSFFDKKLKPLRYAVEDAGLHKKTRRQVAPGAPVGNTGLASPILSGGGIKETRHRCAMCGFFMK